MSIKSQGTAPLITARTTGSIGRWLRNNGYLFAIFAAVIAIGASLSPYFLTATNVENILVTGAAISVLAVGQFMVIVTRGIDLSVGAVAAMATVVAAVLLRAEFAMPLASAATLLFCALFGLLSGALVVFGGITPFVATLAMMSIARGMTYLFQGGRMIVIESDLFKEFFSGTIAFGLSTQVALFIAVMVIFAIIMRWTTFGRQLYAIGGNGEAARLSGLPVTRNVLLAYSCSGLLAGLAGLMLAAQLGQGSSLIARGYELNAIAAAVVGGASLYGGVGTPIGAVLGGLLIGTISNIMDLRGVRAEPQLIIQGALILLAVYLTSGRGRGLRHRISASLTRLFEKSRA